MPVLSGMNNDNLHSIDVHTVLVDEGREPLAALKIADETTVADVIDLVLEKLAIVAGPELFELCEVHSELDTFSVDSEVLLENSRTLYYSECPVSVAEKWSKADHSIEQAKMEQNGVVTEDVEKTKTNTKQFRFYLTQKRGSLRHDGDIKVTWLDGLDSELSADEWHFDPFYREKGELDDLVHLPVLNEKVLLDELCKRFCKGRIYTYVGGILIAMNPFRYFPIYNPKYINAYQHRKLGELPPHVFAIADAAYLRMLRDKKNQCIVISGESGSGKTESTKWILHHLTALSHKTKCSVLEKTILAAGPVLEAFGNAKTCHNNNSSRFGKFTQINYRADGVVCGAALKKYLLEKSRIVSQSNNERNYHVFYCLLAGASHAEREALFLQNPEDYFYLNQTGCYNIDGFDDAFEFTRLKNAINNIGIHCGTQQRMFTILSAVLLIGNIVFKKRSYPDEAVVVADDSIINTIAQLLQVEKQELIQPLTMRKTITRGEEIVRTYKYDEAVATRDSMAKCLYASLFDWIVLQTNHTMTHRQGRKTDHKAFSIGVLDIFGFEDFDTNSFEQFCINLANENLQFYLNQHIFKLTQDEYIDEGLSWDHVDYVDNSTCLNLIVGKPTGLILLLDEECSLTIGTDESLLEKFNRHHANNGCYEMPPTRESVFSVVHYAGKVKYQIEGFRAKNRDLMRSDIVTAFKNSRMLFMREIMGSDPVAIYYWSILRHTIKAVAMFRAAGLARSKGEKMFERTDSITWGGGGSMTPPSRRRSLLRQMTEAEPEPSQQALMRRATKVMNRRVHYLTKKIQSPSRVRSGLEVKRTISGGMTEVSRRGGLKSPPTVIAQFQSSLQELMETLNQSHPFFVRCVRSNAQKSPLEFDAELVLRQLRYTGMLETVKIRQSGYPSRIMLQDFLNQFKLLFPAKIKDPSTELPQILAKIGLDPLEFQIGTTKVYMREHQYQKLRQKLQQKVDTSVKLIQSWICARNIRRNFLQQKKKSITIQKHWRGYQCRKEYSKKLLRHLAAIRIQEFWRSTKSPKLTELHFKKFKLSIIKVQAKWRGYSARKKYLKMLMERQEAEEQKEIFVVINVTDDSTDRNLVGSPYSSHKNKRKENAENMVNDVLKDTIFGESDKGTNIINDSLENISPSPSPPKDVKKDAPLYEEINNFDGIRWGDGEKTPAIEQGSKLASVVRLRTERADTPENLKQKLIRRLSFTKDKIKSAPPIKKAKEAEDDAFEIINDPHDVVTFKSSTWHPSNNSSTSSNSNSKSSSSFGGFFSSLHRKGSKRETPKSDKKNQRRTSATTDNEFIVNGEIELEVFNTFLTKRVTEMYKSDGAKQDADVDIVFKKALHKYQGYLLFTCANASIQRNENIMLKFNDVICSFQEVLDQFVNQDEKVSKEFCVMGCNLFRGIIEEFQKNKEKLLLKRKQHKPYKRKRRKTIELYENKGHLYSLQNFNIQTYCEYCNAFIYDRGLVCQACSFTCHKKCHTRYNRQCKGRRPSLCGPSALFGTDLSEITSPNNPIPQAIIKLMLEIEKRGLYTIGLYRKPGLHASINLLKSVLTSTDSDDLILEDERPHTLSSVLKLFFRQLPNPLIPTQFYDDFVRCTNLDAESLMHNTMYELIQRFPKANRELLERLIVHLSRVCMLEEHNRMSPNALAIIWAPCLLVPSKDVDPLESLQQLPKQTRCIEVLIDVQVKSRRVILNDIDALHRAASTAEKRLDFIINEHHSREQEDQTDDASTGLIRIPSVNREEIEMLEKEINNMDEERYRLTSNLASMEPHKSRSIDSIDDLGSENDFEIIEGSLEDVTDTEEKNKKSSGKYMRLKFAEGHDSSFEDIADPELKPKRNSSELEQKQKKRRNTQEDISQSEQ